MAKLLINAGFSHAMTDVLIITPDLEKARENNLDRSKKLPVLWLLGDYGSDCNDWSRFGNLEYLVKDLNLIVVCPSGGIGYYANSGDFMNFQDIITRQLWIFIMRTFPASDKPEDNFVVGNGMGGYGALLYALTSSDKFSTAACFDADVAAPSRKNMGGDKFINPKVFTGEGPYDLMTLVKKASVKPNILISCGKNSPYYDDNSELYNALKEYNFPVSMDTFDQGNDWPFWSSQLKKFLENNITF